MRRTFPLLFFCISIVLFAFNSIAQQSSNTVKYKITYDSPTSTYTAWVVPDYAVPNANNTGSTELGATAQFTIVVPTAFVITSLTDIHGTWDKPGSSSFLKLGVGQPNQSWTGLDPAFSYYVIGKSSGETNYGTFTAGVPVALFSFKGNSCFGSLKPLPFKDPFITLADTQMQLNVACSFYSRSGQPAGGNQNPLEQFIGLTGPTATCATSTVIANPDKVPVKPGTTTTTDVTNNDKDNGSVVDPNLITITIITHPKHGTATVDLVGKTIIYTPDPDFVGLDSAEYEICRGTSCSSAMVYFDVAGRASDLSLSKSVNKSQAIIGDVLVYRLVVKNAGAADNNNIVVKDTLNPSVQYLSSSANKGSYDIGTKKWTIPTLAAKDSATLLINVKVLSQGVTQNYANIESSGVRDSTLTNNEASACTSVPMTMCSDEQLDVSIPNVYTNVQWYKDGVPFATGNSIVVIASGSYTYTATNSTCPVSGCCPIVVTVNDCCKQNVCVPYTVLKTKSAKR